MSTTAISSTHRLVWTAAMAALTAVGAFISVPLFGVPFSMQTFFVILSGFVLGPVHGAAAMLLYVAAGTAGLPVFAGGKAGVGVLLGPTGGYLAGFVCCAAISGLATARAVAQGRTPWLRCTLLGLAGLAALYGLGVTRLSFVIDSDWAHAFAVGALPFLPFTLVKLVLAVAGFHTLRRQGLLPR